MEYYDVDGTQLISQGVAIGLIGNYSLDMPQKSMKAGSPPLHSLFSLVLIRKYWGHRAPASERR